MLRLEGDQSVLDIAAALDMDFGEVREYLEKFFVKGLIKKCNVNENIIC